MKFLLKNILLLFFLIFSFGAFAQNTLAEKIDNFDVFIDINNDASIDVSERIDYDFEDLNRHGIYRDIVYKYKARGGNYKLDISNIEVKNALGEAYNFQVSNYSDSKRIKIGDANKTISGKKIYIISYKVRGAINYFSEHDELYWNVVGNGWDVPILQSSASVNFPEGIPSSQVDYDCYRGILGNKEECASKALELSANNYAQNILFKDSGLKGEEGLTFAVGIPKRVIYEPGFFEKALIALKHNFLLFLPVLVFFFLYREWRRKGKDPLGRGTIIAQFDAPDNMTPAQVGLLYDEVVDKKDMSSMIVSLAVKGFIKIKKLKDKALFFRKGDDYLFEKIEGKNESELKSYEKEMLSSLFSKKNVKNSIKDLEALFEKNKAKNKNNFVLKIVKSLIDKHSVSIEKEIEDDKDVVKLSSLENDFYSKYQTIEKKVYESLVNEGYFPKNPKTVRAIYYTIGLIVSFASFFAIPLFGLFSFVGVLLSGLIIIIFARFMPVKTKKGVMAREHILGFKRYLEVAEKDRIDFHNAPPKNPETFEKLLPFAMALGVEKQWAKQFEDIYNREPEWYSGTGAFNSAALVGSLKNFQAAANGSMMSSAASGSSGFSGGGSGGGFGGGGGGSW